MAYYSQNYAGILGSALFVMETSKRADMLINWPWQQFVSTVLRSSNNFYGLIPSNRWQFSKWRDICDLYLVHFLKNFSWRPLAIGIEINNRSFNYTGLNGTVINCTDVTTMEIASATVYVIKLILMVRVRWLAYDYHAILKHPIL